MFLPGHQQIFNFYKIFTNRNTQQHVIHVSIDNKESSLLSMKVLSHLNNHEKNENWNSKQYTFQTFILILKLIKLGI